jgi:hypothetical protein
VAEPHAPFEIGIGPESGEGRERLAAVVRRIVAGDGSYRFLLLREPPLDDCCIDCGDVDLLGSRNSVDALIRFLLPMAVAGEIHFRVVSSRSENLQLTLFSRDLAHQATFDLWTRVPQISRGRYFFAPEDLAAHAARYSGAIDRLPPCVEGAIYLQHLASRRKSLTDAHTRGRVEAFSRHTCDDARCGLVSWISDAQAKGRISDAVIDDSRRFLESRLDLRFDDGHHYYRRNARRRISPRAVCFSGVDGVGKTTLVHTLGAEHDLADGFLTGRRLYRRSWVYQVLSRPVRHADPGAREAFDERHCRPIVARAALSLVLRLLTRALTRRGTLLIDRSLADFLYLGRKTDHGGFDGWSGDLMRLAPAVPTIQLVAPHSVTEARKAEVTQAGHERYDREMLERLTAGVPCDHFVFYNGATTAVGVEAMRRYLRKILKIRTAPGVRSAAKLRSE